MQFFEIVQTLLNLLYAINGGKDEVPRQAGQPYAGGTGNGTITSEYLDYRSCISMTSCGLVSRLICKYLNLIQYMHDKYYYEAQKWH